MPLLLGARDGSQNFPLKGSADEVAIWSRALTDGEITTLYNGGAGTQVPEPSTLVLLALALLGMGALAFGWAAGPRSNGAGRLGRVGRPTV